MKNSKEILVLRF